MGWVEGALAEAADLRGMLNLMKDLTLRPERIVDLLEQVVSVEIAFAQAQVEAGADMIDIDWMVELIPAADVFGDQTALCGNFDLVSVMLQSTAKGVSTVVLACQEKGGRKYFSAAGCEIPDRTPEQNLRAQADALRLSGGG
jgi:uroporphyrinogen-III decarboxylase